MFNNHKDTQSQARKPIRALGSGPWQLQEQIPTFGPRVGAETGHLLVLVYGNLGVGNEPARGWQFQTSWFKMAGRETFFSVLPDNVVW